jgi:hypothetical protein
VDRKCPSNGVTRTHNVQDQVQDKEWTITADGFADSELSLWDLKIGQRSVPENKDHTCFWITDLRPEHAVQLRDMLNSYLKIAGRD